MIMSCLYIYFISLIDLIILYVYIYSLLDDLGERVDRSEGRLKTAMRRVTDILKKEEGTSKKEDHSNS